MHPFEKSVLASIRRHGLFPAPGLVVAGVSGGPDSMALLHALAALSPELGLRLIAVYLDHGLRPDEAPAEMALVREQAAGLGAECRILALPVREQAAARGISLEHAGRLLRYEAFAAIAGEAGADRIAVAHTADDQAEEVLLRLLRGTGRKGLSGMLPLRDGRIVRPLLENTKAAILAYLRDRQLPFLIDSSNRDPRFLRNRVRGELLPYLAERFNPNIGETLRRTAAILRDEEALLEQLAGEAVAKIKVVCFGEDESGRPEAEVDPAALLGLPSALQRRVVEDMLLRLGGAPSFQLIESVRQLAASGTDAGTVHLREGLRATRQGGCLRLCWPAGRIRGRLPEITWQRPEYCCELAAPGTVLLPGTRLSARILAEVPPPASWPSWPADLLDADLVPFPLSIRPPRPGDRFHPLGAPGSRKVADFFSDRKIPRVKRQSQPVLLAGGAIVAIPGLRVDHRYRLTGKTRRVLEVRLEPQPAPEDEAAGKEPQGHGTA